MPNPWNMIPAYPPKELGDYIRKYDYTHVYVDLKNVMSSVFIPDVQSELKMNSRNYSNMYDSTIFQSALLYTSFWHRNVKSLGKKCKVFLITDWGTSLYHNSISSNYKRSRNISSVDGVHGLLDDEIKKIRDNNFKIGNKVLNRFPNTYFFNLKLLESDFLCHYLIKEKFDRDDCLHVIASSDKDMFQTLNGDNIFQIYARSGTRYMLNKNSAMMKYLKLDNASPKSKSKKMKRLKDFQYEYIPAMMALVGDPTDDIDGVPGIGPTKAFEFVSDNELVKKLVGSPEEQFERIRNGGDFFVNIDSDFYGKLSKDVKKMYDHNKLITNSYKLISYDMLISWLYKPDDTEKKNLLDYIDKILNKTNISMIPSARSLLEGMYKLEDCWLEEEDIQPLIE